MKRTRTLQSFSLFQKIVATTLALTIPLVTMPEAALALPRGGVVAKGSATLGYSTGKLLITQSTTSATFNWGSFNVKSGQSVVYQTPGSKSVSMNYIGGTTPSSINGSVTSNGILYFMNPNGLIFGSGSVVSAAGVMAFGSATPWGTPTGAVTNAGSLTATNNGTVALVGSSVANSGTIAVPGGEVLLSAGATVTPLAQANGASLSVVTTGGGAIDDSGVLSAETVSGKTGTILVQSGMDSGTVTLESTAVLDASAPNGGNGGAITVNGYKVVLDQIAPLNVSAPSGKTGTILIDPTTLDIGSTSALETVDGNGTASNQSSYLADTICLTASINLGGSYAWLPLGTSSSSPFIGTFNGNGYTVSGYTIGTSSSPYAGNDVGFIGYLGSGGKVENLGVAGTIYASGYYNVGGVVGDNHGMLKTSWNTGSLSGSGTVGGVVGYNNSGTVEYSYNTGSVSGSGNNVGGVVGYNNSGTVKCSYNTGTVTGGSNTVGGVVGYNSGTSAIVETSYNTGSVSGSVYNVGGVVGENNSGTVKYSYNTGSVSGSGTVGGVVGDNSGTSAIVETSYNTGSVSGSSNVGGVVGDNSGTVTDNYYNTSVSDGGGAIGLGSGTYNNGIISSCFAITNSATAGVSNLGTFNTWDSTTGTFTSSATSAPWFEGSVVSGTGTMTAPMLVPDLPSATVTGNGTSVYNGANVTNGYITTYTMGGSAIPSGVTVTTSFGPNVNSYTVTPTISGTISSAPPTQTSVDFVSAVSGTWAITAAPLTVTGTTAAGRTYNGTDTVTLSGATLSGSLYGNNVTLSNDTTGTLSNSGNVGTDSVTTAMTLSGSGAGNFSLTQPIVSSVSITQAPLTVATSGSKIYDGNASLALTSSNTNFTGVYGQTATLNTSLSGTLNSANVGSSLGGSLTVTGSDLTGSSGFSASNYTLPTVFTGGTITQAPLTVTGTTAAGRTYNGTDTVTLSGATLSGSLYGNSVTLSNDTTGTLSNSGNVGTDSVTTAMTLSGSGAGNFSLTQPIVSSVSIIAAPLTVTGTTAAGRTYNGTDTVTLSGATLSGSLYGNNVTLSNDTTGTLSNSGNVGTDSVTTAMTLSGSGAGNFSLTQPTVSSVSITAAPLTVTANSSSMTYGGTVPTLTGTVTGFVNGQTLSGDSGTAIWTTSATSSSNPGQYGITGNVTLGSPYSGDYTITQASGNTTALTITAATSTSGSSGSTGTGGSSSGAVTQGGITATNINPVLQTVDLFQKLPSLPEFSSPGNSPSNASSSPSSSGTATTLGESGSSSLTVIQPVGDDTSGDGILSVEELKNQ